MKARMPSVDIWQTLVVPVEVATGVDPVLGAGVWVGACLEPPKQRQIKRQLFSISFKNTFVLVFQECLAASFVEST